VDRREDVPLDRDTGAVSGGGAMIVLGNIHFISEMYGYLSASLFASDQAATGRTYVLNNETGAWRSQGYIRDLVQLERVGRNEVKRYASTAPK